MYSVFKFIGMPKMGKTAKSSDTIIIDLVENPSEFLEKNPHLIHAVHTATQAHKKKIGDTFEKKIDRLLQSVGIATFRERVMTQSNGVFISDYFYEVANMKYWGEATLNFSTTNVDKLIRKKDSITGMKEIYPEVDTWKWVVFYNGNKNQKKKQAISNAIHRLRSNGWIVLNGVRAINSHINGLVDLFDSDFKGVPLAKNKNVLIQSFIENELNRDKDFAQVEHLAKLIIKYGFTSQITVVPEAKWVRGKIVKTGKYMLIDGHHRLAAVKYLRDMFGYVIEKLPTIIIDSVTTLEPEKVQELMTNLNTNTISWKIPNYIRSHRNGAKQQNNQPKYFAYNTLTELYDICKANGLKPARLLYRVGPVLYKNQSLHIDLQSIKDGKYRLSKREKEEYMMPFIFEVIIPFEKWYMTQRIQSEDVSQLFVKTLYQWFIHNQITLDECKDMCNGFKKLKKKTPFKKDGVNQDMWNEISKILETESV